MSPSPRPGKETVTERLARIGRELLEIDQSIRSSQVDARVMREFREAVDHVRQTAWALQQWSDLEAQHRDAYSVLTLLTQERVKRTTQLARDLALDLDASEVSIETEGVSALTRAVEELFQRLSRISGEKS